jgi:hypothetical protein
MTGMLRSRITAEKKSTGWDSTMLRAESPFEAGKT